MSGTVGPVSAPAVGKVGPASAPAGRDAGPTDALGRIVLSFGRYRKLWEFLHGAARFIIAGPGMLLLWFILDVCFKLPAYVLLFSFIAIAAVSLWALVWWVLAPQLRSIDLDREALVIESLHGKLDNQIIGSLQLGREVAARAVSPHSRRWDAGPTLGYSPQFVSELLLRTVKMLETLAVRSLLDLRQARRALAAALAIVVVIAGCVLFAQGAVRERIERLHDAYALFLDALFPVELRVSPGDAAVIRGRSITLEVEVPGARRREVKLTRTNLGTLPPLERGGRGVLPPLVRGGRGGPESSTEVLRLEDNKARRVIENIQDSFSYSFEYGNRKSGTFNVRAGDRPDVKSINYEMAFPAYTGQPARTLTGRVPRLRGLSGTNVLVSFAATTDLHSELSYVEWVGPASAPDGGGSTRQAIQFSGPGGRWGHFSFPIMRPERATIILTSALAGVSHPWQGGVGGVGGSHENEWRMEQPISFEVDVQRDELPSVQILLKARKMTMYAEQAALFGFEWLAEDDFGVAEVSVEYRIDAIDELLGRKPRQDSQTRLIEPPRERVKGKFNELFKNLSPPLEPGDRITITVSAKDNNTETGPGGNRSAPVEIVVVRPDLDAFVEQQFHFGALSPLGEMVKIKRVTDLLVDPQKTVRTEAPQKIEKKDVKSLARQESWPSGAEDATGDYFRLLSGEK